MANEIKLGQVAGLNLSASPSALTGSVVLWALVGGAAAGLLNVPLGEALVGGLVAVIAHWTSDIVHHLGHAWAARQTGHPMTGVRLWGVIGISLYPPDEPTLPAEVHIRRALGGPLASALLTLLAAVVALALRPVDQTPGWVGAFFFLDNLLFLTLGAFMPLGFTDGSTLLEWWGKRGQ
ncbi:MAG: hypothetical protein PVF45_09550 [Anaerolineae bacterium]|jgi:hypothetical protein